MTARELLVTSGHLSRLAWDNDAVIEFTADRAYCTLGGVTYVAVLPSVERAS